ncbi:MAG: hypothetical protein U0P81_08085 [Holophagaceae bacterium]
MRRGLLLLAAPALVAQEAGAITVNPNRPSFANPATTTQPGVAELEFGLQQSLPGDGSRSDTQPTLLKVGLTEHVELRLGWNGLARIRSAEGATATGGTDPSLGFTWRVLDQGTFGTDVALSAYGTWPRASVAKGIGTGTADREAALLVSKDFGDLHGDLNVLETWVGRAGGGHARQPAAALAFGYRLRGPWSLGAELYAIGASAAGPRTVSTLWNLACQVSSRLVLDAGVDRGLNRDAPRWNRFVGLTWGVGRFLRPH